jgi:hypothetical protein
MYADDLLARQRELTQEISALDARKSMDGASGTAHFIELTIELIRVTQQLDKCLGHKSLLPKAWI